MTAINPMRKVQFPIPDEEPDICAVEAEYRGNEVFLTMQSKNAIIANGYAAKQAAYEMRFHEKISMPNAAIEPLGAAYPVSPNGEVVTAKDMIVKEGQTADQLLEEKGIRYHTKFRLKP